MICQYRLKVGMSVLNITIYYRNTSINFIIDDVQFKKQGVFILQMIQFFIPWLERISS